MENVQKGTRASGAASSFGGDTDTRSRAASGDSDILSDVGPPARGGPPARVGPEPRRGRRERGSGPWFVIFRITFFYLLRKCG